MSNRKRHAYGVDWSAFELYGARRGVCGQRVFAASALKVSATKRSKRQHRSNAIFRRVGKLD
jgi:hypothetical protein